jgi:hypothetical protein
MISIPGLNTRETALVVWLVVLAVWVGRRRSLWAAIWNVVTALFQRLVLAAWGSALVYTVLVVALLRNFRYWDITLLKATIFWFFGSGLVALFNTQPARADYFKRLIFHNLALAVFVEFIVNLYTLPLPVELVLVALMLLLPALKVVSEVSPELAGDWKYDPTRQLITGCLSLLGVFIVLSSGIEIALHWNESFSPDKIREFTLPLILTAAFVPILYFWKYFGTVQTMLVMTRLGMQYSDASATLYDFAKWRVLFSIGFSVIRAELFDRNFRVQLSGATTKSEVLDIIEAFRRTARVD